jgi:hypothetical protein
MDILFQSVNSGIKVAIGSSSEGDFEIHDLKEFIIHSSEDPNCKDPNWTDIISIPNSNAFIDFNGDCLPDIFLTR